MPRGSSGKSMLGGSGAATGSVSQFLADINTKLATPGNVKNVEDIQQIIGYLNVVVANIQAKKKTM
jgi:hypothetical protein